MSEIYFTYNVIPKEKSFVVMLTWLTILIYCFPKMHIKSLFFWNFAFVVNKQKNMDHIIVL